MLDHSESNQIPGSSGPSTESGRDTGELVVDKILSELDECGLAGDRKTIDFPVKSRGKVSILYPGRLESAVWPGPHALTTRVKRCEPANTGAGRCGPGHTKQGCLSSGVAGVALIFPHVDFGSIPAPENVENHMYCHAFHEFSGSKNMEPLEQGQFWRAPAGDLVYENR